MAVWQVMSIPEVLCVSWEGSSGRRTPNPAAIYPTAPACCLPWAWGDGTQGNEATSQDFVLKTPPGSALWMQLLCQQRQPRQTQAALGPWGSQVRSWDSSKLSARPSPPWLQGAGSYIQGCFPSAQHSRTPQPGLQEADAPTRPLCQQLPPQGTGASRAPELLHAVGAEQPPQQQTLLAAKHSPKKSNNSQPCLRATREAAGTRSTMGPHPALQPPVGSSREAGGRGEDTCD